MKQTALVLLVSLLVAGCGGGRQVKEMESDTNSSLVFGLIDMEGSNTVLDWISIAKMSPGKKDEYTGARIADTDDVFYLENLERGSYRLSHFASRLGANTYEYRLPKSGEHMYGFSVGNEQLVFVGAYKFRKIKKGFSDYTFDLTRVPSPGEKAILHKVLPNTKNTKWEAVIKNRLKELK